MQPARPWRKAAPDVAGSQLARDGALLVARRGVLAALGTTALGASAVRSPAQVLACPVSPTETRGPFPADGSNGRPPVNVLASTNVVRRDLRPSFDGLTPRADGVELDLTLSIVRAAGCRPATGAAVYLWQNDAGGDYSLYDRPDANYLRGLQGSDAQGRVSFTLIVPGCYGGRYPHCHLEVFESLADAARGRPPVLVSQLAFPADPCRDIYGSDARYGRSLANLEALPIERDFVFADGDAAARARQTIELSGHGDGGFSGHATIAIG